MGAVALDLLDRRRQHLGAEVLAQPGDDFLPNVVGAAVGCHAADQGQHAQAGEGQDHALAHAAGGMQALVDGGQQGGHGQAAEHAQQHRDDYRRAVGFQQAQQFADGPGGGGFHEA